MGCDVHIHSEIKIAGKWQHYDQPECGRNYALFEKMAGVRGDIRKAIAAPRGVPKNASFTTKFDYKRWGSDAHTASWLSAKEIAELAEWYEKKYPETTFGADFDRWLFGNSYSGFLKYKAESAKGVQDVRFVFWFDN